LTLNESREKKITWLAAAVGLTAIAMSCFHIFTGVFGTLDFIYQRGIHLSFAFTLLVLTKPLYKNIFKGKYQDNRTFRVVCTLIDVMMLAAVWICTFAAHYDYMAKLARAGAYSNVSVIAGIFLFAIVMEFARRTLGWILPILSIIFILYAIFGAYMPRAIAHRGYSLERIFAFLASDSSGLFGSCLSVSASTIFVFVLFGAFLEKSKASESINETALALTGGMKAGPALSSVVASALMGTINGSAVANVVATGTFTIPLMKAKGYKGEFAGGVEAVASSGGQILPPVMGSAAFLMVTYTNISYSHIALAAIIPALLYFLGAAMGVIFNAERNRLSALSREERPERKGLLKDGIVYLIPVAILIYCLMIRQLSANYSALIATAAIPVVMLFDKKKRFSLKDIPGSLKLAGLNAVSIVSGCACAGIVVAMVSLTGIGVVFGDIMISASGGNLFLALLFTALACIILGMGLPTSASYVITASIMGPSLVKLGVPVLAAHMFILYFACLAAITPPVALAAYAGAGIAKADPLKTGLEACKVGFAGFVVPFMFVYNTALLGEGGFVSVLSCTISAAIGVIAVSSAFQRYFLCDNDFLDTVLLLVGGLCTIVPERISDFIGLALLAAVVVKQLARRKKQGTAQKNFNQI